MNTTRHPRTRRFATALKVTPIALAAMVASQPGGAATRTWTGGAGAANPFWDLAANWNTGVPVAGDIASLGANATTVRNGTFALLSMSGTGALTVTGGALSVTAASTTGALTTSGGNVGGSGTLTAASIAWNGGTIGTAGSTGGILNVNGVSTWNSTYKQVHYGQTYNIKGNTTWANSGNVYLYGAGVGYGESNITLFAGKVLTLAGDDTSAYFYMYGDGRFVNNGTIDKNGTNIFYVDNPFDNNGAININAGEVRFRQTRTIGGTINTAAGSMLRFEGSTTLSPGIAIAGDGDVNFNGSAILAAGTLTLGGAGSKSFSGSSLGGAGTIVLNNLTWTNGTMGNSTSTGGVTTVNGETTLGTGTKYVNYGRTVNLNGPVTWDPNGQLYLYGAAGGYGTSTVNLTAGNVMTMAGNSSSYDQIYGPGVFNNAGTINKNGTGILYIDSEFNNTGTVNANVGEVRFRNTRTLGGKLTVAPDAILRFDGNTTFAGTFAVTGNGDIIFDGTANLLTSGSKTIGGTGTKTLVGGTLGGAGTIKLNNLTWLNGTMGAASSVGGVTTVTGATTLSSATHYVNYGRTLNIGATAWDPNGGLYIYGAGAGYGESVVNLAAGKVLTMAGNASSYDQIYGPGLFNNAGTITKSGTGLFYIDSKFNNTGTVNVNKGTLIFRNERTLGGTVNVAALGTLHLNGSTTLDPALVLAGAGKMLFDGSYVIQTSGTRTFGGSGKKTMVGGTLGGAATMVFDNLTWLNGTMGSSSSVGGTTTINGPATLGTSTKYLHYGRTLNLNGDTTWDANGGLYLYGAGAGYGQSVANLAAGKTLALANNASSYDQIYGPGTFNNAGTIAKTGTGIFYVDSILNNSGTLSATKGTTLLRGTINNTGTLVANGGRVEVTAAAGLAQWDPVSQTLSGGTYRVTGDQPIALNLGYLPATSTPRPIKVNQAKIFLSGPGAQIVNTSPDPDVNALTGLTTNNGSAVLSLLNGAKLATNVNLTNGGSATVIVGSGTTNLTVGGGGTYRQNSATASTFVGGTLAVKNFFFDSGTLSAGNAAGLVGNGTIAATGGALTFGALSVLAQDVASAASFDKLTVSTGNLIVDGTVTATFAAGVNVGTYRFLTVTAGTRNGNFDTITTNLNPTNYMVSAVYGGNFVDLVVALKPAASPTLLGNDVAGLSTPGAVNAVPEPGTYALMAAGLALLGWRVRRQRAG